MSNQLIVFIVYLQSPEDCSSGTDCSPLIISWEGTSEIQSGDVLIVEIDDSLLTPQISNKSNVDK